MGMSFTAWKFTISCQGNYYTVYTFFSSWFRYAQVPPAVCVLCMRPLNNHLGISLFYVQSYFFLNKKCRGRQNLPGLKRPGIKSWKNKRTAPQSAVWQRRKNTITTMSRSFFFLVSFFSCNMLKLYLKLSFF